MDYYAARPETFELLIHLSPSHSRNGLNISLNIDKDAVSSRHLPMADTLRPIVLLHYWHTWKSN